jgi:hypothetical protein
MLMGQFAPAPSVIKSADPRNSTLALGRGLVVEDDPSVQKALKHLSTCTVENYILRLRQKLERDIAIPVSFRTVYGMG